MIEISNWSLVPCSGPPRLGFYSPCLRGIVDGESVRTECLVGFDGVSSKRVETADGKAYLMGDVDPVYKDFVMGFHPEWDENDFYWPMLMRLLAYEGCVT